MIYSNYGTDYSNLDNAFDEMEDAHDFLYGINMDELTDDITAHSSSDA